VSRLVPIFLVVASMAIALFLYPFDSDAAFAVHDSIWYAVGAERYPAGSINPHHPLFHGFLIALVPPLRSLGIEQPGHVAARIVSGLGAAWLLLQICALAGRRRILVGSAFALLLLVTRGYIIEVATGENVLPAAAAALFALRVAARPNPSLVMTGVALTFAGLMRQDNVFIVPGIAWALVRGLPPGRKLRGLVWLGVGVGIATAAAYVVFWWFNVRGQESVFHWLNRFGRGGSWTGPKEFSFSQLPVYCFSVAIAMTGRLSPPGTEREWVGLLYVAGILAPGLLFRGSEWRQGLGIPILLTLIGRALFHSWFEADNFEWLVLPVAFLIAYASSLTRGAPATPPAARVVGGALLLGLIAWVLYAHGAHSWQLRDRQLMRSVEEAVRVDRSRWRFLAYGGRVKEALVMLNVPELKDGAPTAEGTFLDIAPRGTGVDEFFTMLEAERGRYPIPTIVIADRFVIDGMPFRARLDGTWGIDSNELAGWDIVRRRGRAYLGRWVPPASDSRPETGPGTTPR
jgi:hypothetical protein